MSLHKAPNEILSEEFFGRLTLVLQSLEVSK